RGSVLKWERSTEFFPSERLDTWESVLQAGYKVKSQKTRSHGQRNVRYGLCVFSLDGRVQKSLLASLFARILSLPQAKPDHSTRPGVAYLSLACGHWRRVFRTPHDRARPLCPRSWRAVSTRW